MFEQLEPRLLLSTTILSEGFEGAFPGSWAVGDANSSGTPAYWDDVDSGFGGEGTHSGSWKGYCADIGNAGTSTSPLYQNSMSAYMSRSINLSGYTSASLTFWYKIPSIESGWDYARVYIDSTKVWERSSAATSWTNQTIGLSSYVGGSHTLKFQFDSDSSVNAEGWYLDDILVTADTAWPDWPSSPDSHFEDNVCVNQNGDATLTGKSLTAGDYHAYRLYWDNSGTAVVETTGSTDTRMAFYDGTGPDETDDDDGSGTNALISRSISSWTEYWYDVCGYSSSTTGSYGLSVNGPSASVDSISIDPATGDGSETNQNIGDTWDYDFYSFTTTASGNWEVDVDPIGSWDPMFNLYNISGNPVSPTTFTHSIDDYGDGGTESYTWSFSSGQTYYIRVEDALVTGSGGDFNITIDGPSSGQADLYDDGDAWSSFNPDSIQAGQAWDAYFDIRNGGSAASGSFYVDFYASTNNIISTSDYFLGRTTVSSIAGGSYGDANLHLTSFPSSVPDDTYYVGIIIDPTNVVTESNESNNTGVDTDDYPLTVTVPPADLYDDGDAWSSFNPDSIQAGQAWDAYFDVRNGGGAASGSFYVDFYASTNNIISTSDYFLGRTTVSSIAGGSYGDANLHLTSFPSSVPDDTYYVGIIIDPTNVVTESNESNNTGVDTNDYPLTVTVPLPDLYQEIDVGNTWINWGQPVTVQGEVHNSGNAPVTGPVVLEFHLSNDQAWGDLDDVYLGSYTHSGGVPVGGVAGFATVFTLPSSPPSGYSGSGPFYICEYTDPNNLIQESNETNNIACDSFQIDTVAPTADLSHPTDGGVISPAAINTAEHIEVTFDDQGGSGLNLATIEDSGHEFVLSGTGVGTAAIASGKPTWVSGTSYRYSFTGSFDSGPVDVNFTAGTWADSAGNSNDAETEHFDVLIPGDADVNWTVNLADLSILAFHWEQPGGWGEGDFDGSGTVDLADLSLLAFNWERSLAGAGTAAGAQSPDMTELPLLAAVDDPSSPSRPIGLSGHMDRTLVGAPVAPVAGQSTGTFPGLAADLLAATTRGTGVSVPARASDDVAALLGFVGLPTGSASSTGLDGIEESPAILTRPIGSGPAQEDDVPAAGALAGGLETELTLDLLADLAVVDVL